MLKLPVRTQTRKYRRKDRFIWTRADAEVVCQGTYAKVKEERQDEMDQGGCYSCL